MISALHKAGADVFRINMSHASHDLLRTLVARIRAVETEVGRPIGILVDLQGPKLRVGEFADGPVQLKTGDRFTIDLDRTPGSAERVCVPHPEIFAALEPGHTLLLDDGRIRLKTVSCDGNAAATEVVVGGKLSDRKGISLPDTTISFGALTEKDRRDLDAALNAGIDWVALSFIQRPDDIAEVRKITRGFASILAKIEKPQAVQKLDEIIDLADALMGARGDPGVEMPLEQVPGIQKRIPRAARRAGKPVIVATQMLESMISAPVPTRAEVSDVATAVFEGADAVRLSAESAAGQYPLEAGEAMSRNAAEEERDINYRNIIHAQRPDPEATGADAISAAARQIAETLRLAGIVCYTASGATALRVARERPGTPIGALSPTPRTAGRLAPVWGVHSVQSEDARDVDDMVDRACRIAFQEDFARAGQRIIIVAGVPFGTPGATNMIRISYVGTDGFAGL